MAETYPSEVQTFRVVGRLAKGATDGPDLDQNPDLKPIEGATVIFTPSMTPPIFRVPTSTEPVTIFQESIIATTDEDGYLIIDGEVIRGVVLPYGGTPGIIPTGWSWSVSISVGGSFPNRSFSFMGSPDAEIDLANVIPVPANPGEEVLIWQQLVDEVRSARDTAVESADKLNDIDSMIASSIADQNIPAKVSQAVTAEDIPGQIEDEVETQVDPKVAAAQSAKAAAEAARDEAQVGVTGPNNWSGAVDLPASTTRSTYMRRVLTGNVSVTVQPGEVGVAYSCSLELQQDAVGGRTVSFANIATPYGLPIPTSTIPNAVDIVRLEWNGSRWAAFLSGKELKIPSAWVV